MESRPHAPITAYCVSVAVCRFEGAEPRVLLLRRREPGSRLHDTWGQVAGAIEPGETAWQAGLRELREETGLVPERYYSADVCEQFYETRPEGVAVVPVFMAFVDSDQEVTLSADHSEYRWLAFDQAEELLLFPGQRDLMRYIEREFIRRQPTELLRLPTSPGPSG